MVNNMKYIIMCGGNYESFEQPRWLVKINGEPIIERTIRLLREFGVNDIYISSNLDCFNYLNVPILKNNSNKYNVQNGVLSGYGVDAFIPLNIPACYICGDVGFSEEALKKIVEKDTDDILFFGTRRPYAAGYPKSYDEPLAFKVVNQKRFRECINKAKYMQDHGLTKRMPISWELYRIIDGLDVNKHCVSKRFVGIHDFALDIDSPKEIRKLESAVNIYLASRK